MNRLKTLLLVGMLLWGGFALSAMETDTEFYFQSGTLTPTNFKFSYFYAVTGFNMNWTLGNLLMLTPECYLVIQDLKLKNVQIAPALIANVKLGNFFVGVGPTKWIKWGSNSVTSDWMMKFNVGLTKYRMIYTLFAVVDFNKSNYSYIGLKLGFNL